MDIYTLSIWKLIKKTCDLSDMAYSVHQGWRVLCLPKERKFEEGLNFFIN